MCGAGSPFRGYILIRADFRLARNSKDWDKNVLKEDTRITRGGTRSMLSRQ